MIHKVITSQRKLRAQRIELQAFPRDAPVFPASTKLDLTAPCSPTCRPTSPKEKA